MKTKIKVLLSVFLLSAFLFSCAGGSQKKGKRMSNSGHHRKIKTEMGGM